MQSNDYQTLKSEIEKTYEEAVAAAERERDENIAALERVWKLAQRTSGVLSEPEIDEASIKTQYKGMKGFVEPKTEKLDSVIDSVREIFVDLPRRFTTTQVISKLSQKHPNVEINKTTIPGTLKRLCENNEIVLVEQGSGRRPSMYGKPQENGEESEDAKQNGE